MRTVRDMPVEYANTVANKANARLNLLDDPKHPALGNPANTAKARGLYREAQLIFQRHGMPALAGAAGGAATCVKIGGDAMGTQMAALMGAFFA